MTYIFSLRWRLAHQRHKCTRKQERRVDSVCVVPSTPCFLQAAVASRPPSVFKQDNSLKRIFNFLANMLTHASAAACSFL